MDRSDQFNLPGVVAVRDLRLFSPPQPLAGYGQFSEWEMSSAFRTWVHARVCGFSLNSSAVSLQLDPQLIRRGDMGLLRQPDAEFVRAGDADQLRGRRCRARRGRARRGRLRIARQVTGLVVEAVRERTRRTAERGWATRRRSPRVGSAGQEREPRRQAQAETDDGPDHGPLLLNHAPAPASRRGCPAASGGCNAAARRGTGQLVVGCINRFWHLLG